MLSSWVKCASSSFSNEPNQLNSQLVNFNKPSQELVIKRAIMSRATLTSQCQLCWLWVCVEIQRVESDRRFPVDFALHDFSVFCVQKIFLEKIHCCPWRNTNRCKHCIASSLATLSATMTIWARTQPVTEERVACSPVQPFPRSLLQMHPEFAAPKLASSKTATVTYLLGYMPRHLLPELAGADALCPHCWAINA